jgi:hypothetical protein
MRAGRGGRQCSRSPRITHLLIEQQRRRRQREAQDKGHSPAHPGFFRPCGSRRPSRFIEQLALQVLDGLRPVCGVQGLRILIVRELRQLVGVDAARERLLRRADRAVALEERRQHQRERQCDEDDDRQPQDSHGESPFSKAAARERSAGVKGWGAAR